MDKEIFKKSPDYPGYEISNQGSIISHVKGYPVKLKGTDVQGYRMHALTINGKIKMIFAHRLVLEVFVGLCPKGMQTCHNNGIRDDNRLENLRWDTYKNNNADKIKHGTQQRGEGHGSAKLKELEVIEIRRLSGLGVRNYLLSKMFKTSQTNVGCIIRRKRWAKVA